MARDEAEDLTHETLLKAINPDTAFENQGGTFTWLLMVARTILHGRRRRERRESSADCDLDDLPTGKGQPDHAAVVESVDSVQQLTEALRQAIQALTPDLQKTMLLRFREWQSTVEIATTLGITPRAVRKRLEKARLAIIKYLKRNRPDMYNAHKRYFERILQKLEGGDE
jgi:RNA polymerase sigma-70 factor (ECF subfamily)